MRRLRWATADNNGASGRGHEFMAYGPEEDGMMDGRGGGSD